ncbi:MAG: hypothetical protein HOH74_15270, partial [Gemmatimonadetes bacterium]|nr:hypothetical protein [Gemmatimonadota bacterium]
LDRDLAAFGRLRVYEYLRLAEDDIENNLLQWVQPADSRGALQRVFDPLAAQDTWINTTYLRFDYRSLKRLNVINKIKVETFSQRDKPVGLREQGSFIGVINKADYTFDVGRVQIQPRWKSEFLRQRPVLKRDPARRELIETLFLVSRFPVLRQTVLELGLEISHFEQFRDEDGVPVNRNLAPDSNSRVLGFQISNTSAYLGYDLNVRAGLRLQKETFETLPSSTTSSMFMTIYAGLGN